jgi:hypothetical protein
MARFTSLALVAAGCAALAACSDNNPMQQKPAAPADAAAPAPGQHLGVVPLRGMLGGPRFANDGNELNHGDAKPGTGPTGQATTTGISYHGGPLLTASTKVAAVYWAGSTVYSGGPTPGTTGAGSSDGSNVGYFLNHIGGSPYFNINTTYYNSAGTHVANIVSYTQFWANNSYNVPASGASVSDAQMLSMLQYAFNNGKLTYNSGTLYLIFTKGTVNLGGGFGTQYCAYHSWGNVTVGGVTHSVLYAAMPDDYAKASACSSGYASPNGDLHADAEVSTTVHEIEETTTDMNGNAWYDSAGNENADKCAWNYGSTFTTANGGVANVTLGSKNFLIQQNWVNSGSGGCRLSW